MLVVLNADPLLAAFEWPWQQGATQKEKSSSLTAHPSSSPAVSSSPVMPQAKDNSRNADQPIGQTAAALKKDLSQAGRTPVDQLQTGLSRPSVPAAGEGKRKAGIQNSFMIKAPQRNANYEEVVKLQAKLNDLIHISTEMDRLNRSKVAAVQSMIDKARVNQKVLARLASPDDTTMKIRKVDADQILLSKKLRGMREEAEKQMALAQSRKSSVSPGTRTTA